MSNAIAEGTPNAVTVSLTTTTVTTLVSGPAKVIGITVNQHQLGSSTWTLGITRSGTRYLLNTLILAQDVERDGMSGMVGLATDTEGNKFFYVESGDVLDAKSTLNSSLTAIHVNYEDMT